jgi:hypothetical protein
VPISEQPAIDLRDTRLALGVVLDCVEYLIRRVDYDPLYRSDKEMLKQIDLARSVLSDETERDV